uniref:HAT C-terminal dimerisation domain-containing protein n=1 Tax=Amphimedon queenslandica TaxID=400682 RepID=A0A1X7T0Z4_AMPQE
MEKIKEKEEAEEEAEKEAASIEIEDTREENPEEDTLEENSIREELNSYLAEMEPSRGTSPSMWWKDNSKRFPLLSQVAMDFLHIPATSTPSERVFSTAGNTVTQKRNCLKPKN